MSTPSGPSGYNQSGGLATLTVPASGTGFNSGQKETLVSWRASNGKPMPIEVGLSCQTQGYTSTSVADASLFCGQLGSNVAWQCGYFYLTYGCGSIVRRRWVDLASATLYLGVCDQVTVVASRWAGVAWPDYTTGFSPVQVGASVALAGGGEYDELVSTQQSYWPAGGAVEDVSIPPPGAHSCAVSAGFYATTNPYYGSGEPDLLFNGKEPVLIRPSQYSVVPPFRRTHTAQGFPRIKTNTNVLADTVFQISYYLGI